MADIFKTSKVQQKSGKTLILDDGQTKSFCIYRPDETDDVKLMFCSQPEELQMIEFFNDPLHELITHLNTYGFSIEGVFDENSFFNDTDYAAIPDNWNVSLVNVVVETYSTLKIVD